MRERKIRLNPNKGGLLYFFLLQYILIRLNTLQSKKKKKKWRDLFDRKKREKIFSKKNINIYIYKNS